MTEPIESTSGDIGADGTKKSITGMSRDTIRKLVQERVNSENISDRPLQSKEFIKMPPEISDDQIMRSLSSNQVGDAYLFALLNQAQFLYDYSIREWFEFSNHLWRKDDRHRAVRAVNAVTYKYHEMLDKVSLKINADPDKTGHLKIVEKELRRRINAMQTRGRINDILELAAANFDELSTDGNKWNENEWVLPVRNGVVDLKNGELYPGRPSDLLNVGCDTHWIDIETPAPLFEKFVYDILEDREKVEFLQRLFGYFITGMTTEEILALFYGRLGRNGKTKLIETIKFVLGMQLTGSLEVESIIQAQQNRSAGGARSDIMSLRGKRLVTISESEENHRFSMRIIKFLTGGYTVVGREMYARSQTEFKPSHKFIVSSNFELSANSDDEAFWARVVRIDFPFRFVSNPTKQNEKLKDPNLIEKLKLESSGILAWLVRGCLDWQINGLCPPDSVLESVSAYKNRQNPLYSFISECTQPGGATQAADLYSRYSEFETRNGSEPIKMTMFGKKMKEKADSFTKGHVRYYRITLTDAP